MREYQIQMVEIVALFQEPKLRQNMQFKADDERCGQTGVRQRIEHNAQHIIESVMGFAFGQQADQAA